MVTQALRWLLSRVDDVLVYLWNGLLRILESMLWATIAALTAAGVVALLVMLGAHEAVVDALR